MKQIFARCIIARIYRCMEDDVRRPRLDAKAAFRHQRLRSVDRNRNARRSGLHRQVERTFFERQQSAVLRTRTLDESSNVDALPKYALCRPYAFLCCVGAARAVDRDEPAQLETVAE